MSLRRNRRVLVIICDEDAEINVVVDPNKVQHRIETVVDISFENGKCVADCTAPESHRGYHEKCQGVGDRISVACLNAAISVIHNGGYTAHYHLRERINWIKNDLAKCNISEDHYEILTRASEPTLFSQLVSPSSGMNLEYRGFLLVPKTAPNLPFIPLDTYRKTLRNKQVEIIPLQGSKGPQGMFVYI